MMRLLMFIFISLNACTPVATPVAYDCPVVQLPANPKLYFKNLKSDTPMSTAMKYCVHDVIAEKGWNTAVRTQNINSE